MEELYDEYPLIDLTFTGESIGFIILINSKFFLGFYSDVTNLNLDLFNGSALLLNESEDSL